MLIRIENPTGCANAAKTVFYLVSKCSVMAQEYKGRHDKVAKTIHWDMSKEKGVEVSSKLYEHVLEKVVGKKGYGKSRLKLSQW